jgi:hypothetical protein
MDLTEHVAGVSPDEAVLVPVAGHHVRAVDVELRVGHEARHPEQRAHVGESIVFAVDAQRGDVGPVLAKQGSQHEQVAAAMVGDESAAREVDSPEYGLHAQGAEQVVDVVADPRRYVLEIEVAPVQRVHAVPRAHEVRPAPGPKGILDGVFGLGIGQRGQQAVE